MSIVYIPMVEMCSTGSVLTSNLSSGLTTASGSILTQMTSSLCSVLTPSLDSVLTKQKDISCHQHALIISCVDTYYYL